MAETTYCEDRVLRAVCGAEALVRVFAGHSNGTFAVTAAAVGEENRGPERSAGKVRFPRSGRLLRHADFERVYKQGRRHFSPSITVFYLQRQPPSAGEANTTKLPVASGLRVGFTVGRALGGAVQRNRMKRRLREAVRLTRAATEVDVDVVINPKKSILTADFSVLVNEVSRAFAVIGQKAGTQRTATEKFRRPEGGSRKPN